MIYKNWIKHQSLRPYQSFGDGHWEIFSEARRKHNENICSETNKLVLRLDKLINASSDGQKPDLDKSVVEWTSDSLVKLCPFCAKAFTFARRRHHCRACGAILCSNCSHFLEYKAACKLVRPAKLYTDPFDRIEDRLQSKEAEEMPNIRTCEDCKRLLDKRIQTIEDYYCQPTFYDLYEKLRKTMAEADELMNSYSRLVGEQKQPDLELKSKIQALKQEVVTMSAKLSKMVARESGKQAYLLSSINQSIAYWLKESTDSKINRTSGNREQQGSGFAAQQPVFSPETTSSEEENAIVIQIKNLEEYIKQARQEGLYEEVSVLEANKRDLEIEYLIQKNKDLTM